MKTMKRIILCSQGECENGKNKRENYDKSLLNETTVLKQINRFILLFFLPVLSSAFCLGQSTNLSINIKSSAKQSCLSQPISFSAVINPLVTTNQLVDSFDMTTFAYYQHATSALLKGQKYLMIITGVYSAWTRKDWFIDAAYFYQGSTIMKEGDRVNSIYSNRPLIDVPDTVNHRYEYCLVGRGVPLTVTFFDSNYDDNRGSLHFELYAVPTTFSYSWSFGDGTTSSISNPVHNYLKAGIYPVTLTFKNDVCANDAYAYSYVIRDTVIIFPLPIVNAGIDQSIYLGYGTQSVALMAPVNEAVNYLWSTKQTTASITVSPMITTIYKVTVTNNYGCKASDDVIVTVTDVRCCKEKDDKKDKDEDKDKKDKDKDKCKVMLCHIGKDSSHTICVNPNAVAVHLAHGDYLGKCDTNIFYYGNSGASLKKGMVDNKYVDNQEPSISTNVFISNITFKNFPNPAKDVVTIRFSVPESEIVKIEILDVTGRYLTTLFEQIAEKDKIYSLDFQTQNFPNGIYLLRLSDAQRSYVNKMVVLN